MTRIWFRDYARVHALPALGFAGSATLQDAPERVAEAMRQTLALSIAERRERARFVLGAAK